MIANAQRMTVWGMPRLRMAWAVAALAVETSKIFLATFLAAWAAVVVVAARAASKTFLATFLAVAQGVDVADAAQIYAICSI